MRLPSLHWRDRTIVNFEIGFCLHEGGGRRRDSREVLFWSLRMRGGCARSLSVPALAYVLKGNYFWNNLAAQWAAKKKKTGRGSETAIYFFLGDLYVFNFKKRDYKKKKPAAGADFFLPVSQKLLGACFQ